MAKSWNLDLSRRERQIMDLLYRLGEATAAKIRADLPSPPTYSAVRALLRVLTEKGHVKHRYRGPRYVYKPKVSREKARQAVLDQVVQNFFDGSAAQVVNALLDRSPLSLSEEDLERMSRLIDQAKKEGR